MKLTLLKMVIEPLERVMVRFEAKTLVYAKLNHLESELERQNLGVTRRDIQLQSYILF